MRATSFDEAVTLLQQPGSAPLGGGTDLLVLIQERLASPSVLVDVAQIDGSARIRETDHGASIGPAARIADIAEHTLITTRWPALAQACASVATPALRNMGTLAGNLCQRPRCWYFRRGVPCLKNGGGDCPARTGENQYHAILGGGPCWIVHPSDPAVALAALDATIVIARPGKEPRELSVAGFFQLPSQRMDAETVVQPGELITEVRLPVAAAGGNQRYYKVMQRGAWDFALVSLAAAKREGGEVRLVLGGVAPVPWRIAESVEEDVAVGDLDDESIEALAERALHDARPLPGNGYKVQLAGALLREAIRELSS